MKDSEEKPPILKTWTNVYLLVIGTLAAIIISLYLFTQFYK